MNVVLIAGLVVFLAYKQVQAALERDVITYINGFRHLHAAGPLLVDDVIQKNAKSAAAVFAKTKNKNAVPLFQYSANFCTFTGVERDLSRKCVVSWYVSMRYYSWCEPKAKGPALPFVNLIWKASTRAGVGITKAKTGAYYVVLYIGMQDSDNVVRNVPPVKVVMEASPKAECPIGYSRFDTSCFRYQNIPVTWDEAVYRCALENATLASIRNAKDEEFVRNLQLRVGVGSQTWIGLHDSLHEGRFKWFDGLKFHKGVCVPVTAKGGISENCVAWSVSNPKGCWEDRRCDEKIPFTCRIPVEGKSTYRTEILFKKFRWRPNYKDKSSKAYRDLVNGVKVTFKELFTRMSGKKKGGFRKVKVKSVRPVSFQGRPAGLGITLSLKFRSFTPDPTVRFQKFLRDSEKIISMAIDKPDKVEGKTGRAGSYCYNACNQRQGSCGVQARLQQETICPPYCFTANPVVTSKCPPSCPPACCSASVQQPPPYNYYPGYPAPTPPVPYPSYPWGIQQPAYSYDSYPQTCPAVCSQYPTLDCFMHCNDECCVNRAGRRMWSPKAIETVKAMKQNFQKLKQLVAAERNKPKIVSSNMKGKDLKDKYGDDKVRTADVIKVMKTYIHNLESGLPKEHESKAKKVNNMEISAPQTERSNSSLSNTTITNTTDDDEGKEMNSESLIDSIKDREEQEGQYSMSHKNPSNESEPDNESVSIDNTDKKFRAKADYKVAGGRMKESRARNMGPSGVASRGSKEKDDSTPRRSKEVHEGAKVGNKSLPAGSGGNGGPVERQKTDETTAIRDGKTNKNQSTMESNFPVENSSLDDERNGHHKADFRDEQEEHKRMNSNDINEMHDPVMNGTETDFINDEVSNDPTDTQGTDEDESDISLGEEESATRDRNSSFAADIDTSDEEYERKKENGIPEPLGTDVGVFRRNESLSGDKVSVGGEGEQGNNTINDSVVEDFHDTSHTKGKGDYTTDIGSLDEYRNDINNETWTKDNLMDGNKVRPSLNEEAKHMLSESALHIKNGKTHEKVSKNGGPGFDSNDHRHEEYIKEVSNQTWTESQRIDANKDVPVQKDGAKYMSSESAFHKKIGKADKEMNRNGAPDNDSNNLKHEDHRMELSNETWTEDKPMGDNNDGPLLNDGAEHVPSESALHFKDGTTVKEINTNVKGAPDADNDRTHAASGTPSSKEKSLNHIGSGDTLNDDVDTQINQVKKGSSPETEKEILDDGSNTSDTAEQNEVGTSQVVNSTLGAGEADNSLIDFHELEDETTDELLDQEGIGDTDESGKKRNKVTVAKKSKHR